MNLDETELSTDSTSACASDEDGEDYALHLDMSRRDARRIVDIFLRLGWLRPLSSGKRGMRYIVSLNAVDQSVASFTIPDGGVLIALRREDWEGMGRPGHLGVTAQPYEGVTM